MKKKILFVMSNLNNGGAERSLVNLLQLLDYDKYEVDLILFQHIGMFYKLVPKEVNILHTDLEKLFIPNLKSKILKEGINKYDIQRLIYTYISKRKGKNSNYLKEFKQYRWINYYKPLIKQQEKKYDVAIAYLHGEPINYLVDCINSNKKIGWVHNEYTKSGWNEELDRQYYEQLDKIITISETCAEILREVFPSCIEKIGVLPNLTSSEIVRKMAEAFTPDEYENIKEDKKEILVSIGRLNKQKGFDIAIETADILKRRGINFKWFILGSGELEKSLNKYRKEKNVDDVIEFIGSRENPYPYLKNADIVVQPSRFEGKSIVIDEAKILAKPIVVTNYTTVRNQIVEDEGIITEMQPDKIADGIIKMMDKKNVFSERLISNEYGNIDKINLYYEYFNS